MPPQNDPSEKESNEETLSNNSEERNLEQKNADSDNVNSHQETELDVQEAKTDEKIDPELEGFIQRVVSCMLDKKALALRVVSLEGVVDYCDRLVICSAGASRQVAAIADHIHGVVKKELNRLPSGVEGRSNEQWVVMDYGDVMIHVFSHDARAYYAFDDLWLEAKIISLSQYGVEDEGALSNPDMARYM